MFFLSERESVCCVDEEKIVGFIGEVVCDEEASKSIYDAILWVFFMFYIVVLFWLFLWVEKEIMIMYIDWFLVVIV